MTDVEYWKECELVSAEIDAALRIFHTLEEINRRALDDGDVHSALNDDALFWNVQVHSLQTALFIVLGRIFDADPDAHSIHRIVRAAQEHTEFFSKEAIAARRSPGGVRPVWLDDFLAGVWAPEPTVLRELKNRLKKYSTRFREIYRPIRHQFYAHKPLISDDAVSRMFERTDRKELEEIIHFLRGLVDTIQDLYLNGNRPEIVSGAGESYKKQIRASTRSVLDKIVTAAREEWRWRGTLTQNAQSSSWTGRSAKPTPPYAADKPDYSTRAPHQGIIPQ